MTLFDLVGDDGIVITNEENLSVDAALDLTCSTLIAKGKVEASYADAIKATHKKIGPYYVLAPRIAMPHARPEDGVNETALQLTVFKKGVDLGSVDNGNVFFSITLAAVDSDGHVLTIMALSELFQNDEDIEKIITAEDKAAIIKVLKKY